MQKRESDTVPTRASLLGRVKDLQDQASWQEFHDTYRSILYAFARKAGLSTEEAEDAVQETFRDLTRQMPSFEYDRARGSFKAWLLKLARWRVIDQYRQRPPVVPFVRTPAGENSATRPTDLIPDPASLELDRCWDEQWAAHLLQAAERNVRQKADAQRFQIFDLCVHKELPPQKVADAFGISIGRVYLAKHRITQMIKAEAQRLDTQLG